MKTVLFILFSFLLPLTVFPQIIVQNPRIGFSNTESIIISQIEINSRETILTFKTMMSPGSRFGISGKSFIKVVGQSDTLFLTKQDAPIPVDGWITVPPEGITYKLYFPPIDSAAFKIDFGELHDSSWYMYDIELGDQPHNSIVPIELLGDWFSEESGKWTFSFWDSIAIVNSKIWDYFSVVMDNENYKVILENNGDKLYILYKKKDDGLSQISINDNQSFKPYTKDVSVLTKSLDEDMDYKSSGDSGVVVYQGIFKGYRPEFGSYCSLEVGDGLKSNRDYYAFEIDTNGSFRVELKLMPLKK
ncbi:MAG: hypothetical protein HQ541_16585 [Mariniphaga sp.]|nr:hypothetical protein [Mariniphaga sp.]